MTNMPLTACITRGKIVVPMSTSTTTVQDTAMKEHLTVVTRKGQITIPAEIRKTLGIQQGDKVVVVSDADGQQASLRRVGSVAQQTFGALATTRPRLTPQQEREAFEQGVADEVMAETPPRNQPAT
jgi:AbrB family looped-hinge helix DNA binding protein